MIRAAALLVLLGLTLVGCAAPSPVPTSADPSPAASAPAEATPVEIPEGIIGRGELLLPDGSPFGEATIEWRSGGILLHLPELAPLGASARLVPALADGDVAIDQCGEPNVWAVGIGDDPQSHPLVLPEFMGDPSFFRYLLVVEPGVVEAGCTQPIRALARLEWDVPAVRPWIEVADSGAASGARGATMVRDGAPVLYRTAPGDAWNAIADRFGITGDDLAYLNPIRLGNFEPGVAYAGQVLNLDATNRGDSETRRPGAPLTEPDAF